MRHSVTNHVAFKPRASKLSTKYKFQHLSSMNSDSRAPIIITEEGEGQGHSPEMNSEGQEDFPKMNSTDFGEDMEHHSFDWNEKLDEFKSLKNIYANR